MAHPSPREIARPIRSITLGNENIASLLQARNATVWSRHDVNEEPRLIPMTITVTKIPLKMRPHHLGRRMTGVRLLLKLTATMMVQRRTHRTEVTAGLDGPPRSFLFAKASKAHALSGSQTHLQKLRINIHRTDLLEVLVDQYRLRDDRWDAITNDMLTNMDSPG